VNIEIGVAVHHDRVLSAHLGDDVRHMALRRVVARGALDDLETDGLRAGEGHERDLGVLDEIGTYLLTDAGEEGEHAGWHPGGVEDVHKP
jgi:thioredoxin reductase